MRAQATLRVLLMFAVLMGIFALVGWVVGSYFIGNWMLGFVIFLGIAVAINVVSYFYSSKIILWTYKVKIVTEAESPRLYRIVRGISQKAGLPMPRVGIIPTQNPNAFATGRNPKNAVVCATEGIMRLLDDNELEGVMAHEMAHVKDRDILVMTVAATVAGAISFAARFAFWGSLMDRRDNGNMILLLLVAITAPLAAMLVQMAISRSREYKADYEGAMFIGRPLALAKALEKLEVGNKANPIKFGSPTSSSLFIVNPFNGGAMVSLFSTHPPMKERIRRLREQAKQMGQYA